MVDDDEKVLTALSLRLEAAGYDVLTASDGANGMDTALAQHPHLILMDICMPHGSGLCILERLHGLKQERMPVIFITGYALPSLEREALDLGAVAVFEKPYDFRQLRMVIERVLGGVPSAAPLPAYAKSPGRPPVVLIVEDDPRITLALVARLRAAGHVALTASNGIDGLRLAATHRPDLIVMDIWTPAGTGFAVARHLKDLGLAEIPLIFMTASRADSLRGQAARAGAIAYFEKPYDGEALLETIEQALHRPRSQSLAA